MISEEDYPELAKIEHAYGIELTEQEIKLLTTSKGLLSPVERQEKFLLEDALEPLGCPGCRGVICQRSAYPGYTAHLNRSIPDHGSYECPLCTARLDYWMTIVGTKGFDLAPGQTIQVPEVAPTPEGNTK